MTVNIAAIAAVVFAAVAFMFLCKAIRLLHFVAQLSKRVSKLVETANGGVKDGKKVAIKVTTGVDDEEVETVTATVEPK